MIAAGIVTADCCVTVRHVASQVNIPQKAITARRVVTQLLHSCRRLGDVLVGVLPPREHVRLAAALLQSLAETIISAPAPAHLILSRFLRPVRLADTLLTASSLVIHVVHIGKARQNTVNMFSSICMAECRGKLADSTTTCTADR